MKKVIFFYSTGYAGMDTTEVVEYPDDVNLTALDEHAWWGAVDNACNYGIYPESDMDDDVPEDEQDNYTDNIDGYWEWFDETKHSGYL